ncbi:MAG: hypothetical protein IJO62_00505 [Clostridia bacterium]|nr:hypothetical protein [Clostridia bacterium]
MVKEFKNDTFKLISLFIFITYAALYDIFSAFFGGTVIRLGLIALCYGSFLFIFVFGKERIYSAYLVFLSIFGGVIIFYSVLNGKNNFLFEEYALPTSVTLFSGVVGFYFMAIQRDAKGLNNMLKITTLILTAYYYLYSFDIVNSEEYEFGYSMGFGFRVLLPCILSLHFAFEKREKKKILSLIWFLPFALCMFLILTYGSRGPIIGVLAYLILRFGLVFLLDKKVSFAKKMAMLLLIILGSMAVYTFFGYFVEVFADYLDDLGITSRTITRILNQTIADDNGRDFFFKKALSKITVAGLGPFSDQYMWGRGNYCHNFFLEVLLDFGFVIGMGIIILVIVLICKIIGRSEDNPWFSLFVVFLSYCLGRLMFSGTFWSETMFWMTLGLGWICLKRPDLQTEEKENDQKNPKKNQKIRIQKNI